jgi:plasmid stabilization system protein ParE
MNLLTAFRPEAEADVLETRDWYEQQQHGLGDSFRDSLDQIVVRIQTMPQMYAVVFRDVRRGKLRRFPYVIYYRVLPNRIEVIAVLHGSRDPRLWQERVR